MLGGKSINNQEQVFTCPECHKERHFYVNATKRVAYCQRCGYSVGPKQYKQLRLDKVYGDSWLPYTPISRTLEVNTRFQTPPEYDSLSDHSYSYLVDRRGISPEIVDRFPIYDTQFGILFLFPQEDYWQVRRWRQFSPPRWENPSSEHPVSPSEGVSYLVDTYPSSKRVVLVEGILDALAVGRYANAAAVLTNQIKEAQAFLLSDRFDEALVLLDKDVPFVEAYKRTEKISSLFESCHMIWPYDNVKGKDPASIPKNDLRTLLQ
jgi:hypothetical protein